MKQILETLYMLGMENPWIAALTVSGALVTIAVVCVLGCMVACEIRNMWIRRKEGK
ncbi:hypothetical protein [Candidatus Proelusimicrobium excrementi]|uniref:hypothetical protein n=1 Tax=Candidatus Proelusimicrobium excrementi TaxID=3416222 RepID=UPI003CB32424|nr:hypothetical protein [Elusimicrobiaceae bacterium]MBR3927706.1 hypothetical protein [Clostridia bacterium]